LTPSEIVVSSDGKFVYGANPLHDSISSFSIGADGKLSLVDEVWTHGDYPSNFSLDPGGNFLYSCNQHADAIAAFRVNRKIGHLTFTGQYTSVRSPSHVVFSS
jgi:6-phosphogluconolactonase (cycloisomerase 2 family)